MGSRHASLNMSAHISGYAGPGIVAAQYGLRLGERGGVGHGWPAGNSTEIVPQNIGQNQGMHRTGSRGAGQHAAFQT